MSGLERMLTHKIDFVAQWYPLPFFCSGFPCNGTNQQKGAIIIIWLLCYQDREITKTCWSRGDGQHMQRVHAQPKLQIRTLLPP